MFKLETTITPRFERVEEAADDAAFKNFGHAAARIRKDAQASIEVSDEPADEGEPPHTRPGKRLPRSIRFDADNEGAIIGPVASIAGTAGAAHEHGGDYLGQHFPEREFMWPALESNSDRFANDWEGSIGE